MYEQVASREVAANKDASKLKRAGRACIALFVAFVVSLLGFAQAPVQAGRPAGWRLFTVHCAVAQTRYYLDVVSCIGVAMGVFALVFLLFRHKRVMRVTAARRVLGIIGCIGLVLHTLLATFVPVSWDFQTPVGTQEIVPISRIGTQEIVPIYRVGPETWVVDGKTYNAISTYYLSMRDGVQYTIEYPYHPASGTYDDLTYEQAVAIVFPIMKDAYVQGLYSRSKVNIIGKGPTTASLISVTLFDTTGTRTILYRVVLTLDQIKQRMDVAGTNAPAPP